MSREAGWAKKARTGEQWSEGDAREAIAAWAASGESMTGFARRHGVTPQRLSWWRLRTNGSREPSRTSLIPVTVTSSPLVSLGAASVTVTMGDLRIDVEDPSRVSPSWVAALLSAMRESGR